ncbi:MAG: hypothetical protein H6823_09435 [Planctomycetaceae bacterium]|nr:hypothetical protein [Planctomycetaceae bacterium]
MARTLRRELTSDARNATSSSLKCSSATTLRADAEADYRTVYGRVLTMERIDGTKLENTEQLRAAGVDLAEVARRGAELYLDMIFMHGFYHADPHPGNIVVTRQRDRFARLWDGGAIGRATARGHRRNVAGDR